MRGEKTLKCLFKIFTGYSFRESIINLNPGDVRVIQSGDVVGQDLYGARCVDFHNERHLLQAGDILVSARGELKAASVQVGVLPAVAASSVMVLRPKNGEFNSRYIAHFLNSSKGQSELVKSSSGSHVVTIRKSDLEQVKVSLPRREAQDALVRLHDAVKEQSKLLRLKSELLQSIENSAINQLTGENS